MKVTMQAAVPATNSNPKTSDLSKAVDGLWAALLQGSASGTVEKMALPAKG